MSFVNCHPVVRLVEPRIKGIREECWGHRVNVDLWSVSYGCSNSYVVSPFIAVLVLWSKIFLEMF